MSAVAAEHVWKFYGDYPALRDISFEVRQGSCLALLGRNGAGKTTLLRILAGLSRASKGQVTLDGANTLAEASRRRIGILGHGIAVYDELSALENLELFARLYDLPDPVPDRPGVAREDRPRAGEERSGARVLARHAAAAGRGPGVSA